MLGQDAEHRGQRQHVDDGGGQRAEDRWPAGCCGRGRGPSGGGDGSLHAQVAEQGDRHAPPIAVTVLSPLTFHGVKLAVAM